MTNITINSLPTASTIDGSLDILPIYTASSAATQGINRNTLLNLTSGPVGLTDSQTLTNKILTAPTISSPVLSGTLTGTYTIGGTPTFPSSVVTLTGLQTLTNKTLTSPTITSPTITNATISADTITGFSSTNNGTLYGISIASSQITSNMTMTGTLTVSSTLTASNGLTVSSGSVSVPNNTAFIVPANLIASTGTTWAWQTWSPTLTNLSGGTQTEALYCQIGKTVFIKFKYTLGGAGMGSGPLFTLPVTAAAANSERAQFIASLQDTGIALYYGFGWLQNTTQLGVYCQNVAGTYASGAQVTATVPFTWGSTDILFVYGSYEAA